jgi:hypothetical protein
MRVNLARWVSCIFMLLHVVGCSEAEAPKEQLGAARQAISREIRLRYPAGSFGDVPLVALDGALMVGDRARAQTPAGTPAGALQLGAAPVNVGVEAKLGTLRTQGAIRLRDRARVDGDVSSGGLVTKDTGVVVTGVTTENAVVTPFNEERFSVDLDSNPANPVDVGPDATRTLAPGRYGALALKSRSTLDLRTGDYAFTTAMIEPTTTIRLDDVAGPVRLFLDGNLTFRGVISSVTGQPPALLVVQFGASTAMLDAAFKGTVMAPAGSIVLGPGGQPHEGSFFAKSVEVRPDTTVTYRPYFQLRAVERFSVPSGSVGPFGILGFDNQGGFLTNGRRTVLSISSSGAVTPLMPEGDERPFVIDARAGHFGTYTRDHFELRDRTGAMVFAAERDGGAHASIIPGTQRVVVAEVGSDPEKPKTTHLRIQNPGGVERSLATPGLRVWRLTTDHVVYATNTELVRVSLAGVESWRRPLALSRFELASNGTRLVGLLARAANTIVQVDLATGNTLASTPLGGSFWNMAIAPGGRYSAATTKDTLYLFDGGTLSRTLRLPVTWAVSLTVNDDGFAVIGAQMQDHRAEVLLVGPHGTGIFRAPRGSERFAWHPAPQFFPSARRFVVVQSSGLTVYDIERVR